MPYQDGDKVIRGETGLGDSWSKVRRHVSGQMRSYSISHCILTTPTTNNKHISSVQPTVNIQTKVRVKEEGGRGIRSRVGMVERA